MDKDQEPRRIVSAVVDPSTADRLEQLAHAGDRTLSAEIRRALREHVAKPEQPEGQAA